MTINYFCRKKEQKVFVLLLIIIIFQLVDARDSVAASELAEAIAQRDEAREALNGI